MSMFNTTHAIEETGQAMTEYAVVLSLIVVVTLAAFTSLGDGIATSLNTVRSILP